MASILRQIVAGPRQQHPEAGLDLCYVTDNLIATSGPSSNYPQRAYRNPLDALVHFLDSKHGSDWCIWEFRAEGTGYPDSEVYGRIHHYPWPDHHPPPFALLPAITGSMRNYIHRLDDPESANKLTSNKPDRVAVVHCKAGKGRSGTVACSYLISQEGWKAEDALQRFTERRMRVGFGAGVSIPSQLRWVGYVDRWTNQLGKKYIERPVEILEVHVWGLRDGVKVAVEGYVDHGKRIKRFHRFHKTERTIVDDVDVSSSESKNESTNPLQKQKESSSGSSSPNSAEKSLKPSPTGSSTPENPASSVTTDSTSTPSAPPNKTHSSPIKHISNAIFRPRQPIIVPASDVNIDFERRSKAAYTGWAMVTSIAHVWFNAYFEGGHQHDSGVFSCEWDGLDGIKGTTRKGVRALDRVKVVWRYAPSQQPGVGDSGDSLEQHKNTTTTEEGQPISEPKPGEPAPETQPPDWHIKATDSEQQENLDPSVAPNNSTRSLTHKSHKHGHGHGHKSSTTSDHSITAELTATAAASLQDWGKHLGLRKQTDESKDTSLAGSEDEVREAEGKAKTKT
ncbi:putative phosphatidylinositol-3,4,5-trisphosphate 3-phosphatase [Aspergillus homomorphus CBS 101889]|uniref:phosphatidylinositol-3,4,5-trisphosphate 3-phosphatase n=1 Tax=Aspergillus homomorphus (strain CBS 101889) TaxID=1450537 RepID=A0A395ICE9_ASPHC|nr:phosphatases II [Aspergillus homomorphus CBS 101889]RAL17711.1 phosphatases II [Aspergillus homomorphus CBS 101889]